MGHQHEANTQALQRVGASAAEQDAEAAREGEAQDDRTEATRRNQAWAMDFVQDQLATDRKLRVLTIIDTWSRFSPAVDPRFSYRGEDVVATLERVCREHGYPQSIRVDQGSEFVSRDLDMWAYQRDVVLEFSRPESPPTTRSSSRSTASSERNA
ncbi:transposase InsO family protein [Aminobacter lissarensis]|uniref:Transposase InsO family protein n=1 Tax=Aminobacter carboxidus TaxID=376165 RepID=A0A8E1WH47_9HYPH|nr:transposase InsO family protein [Aminobacter lissarensis]